MQTIDLATVPTLVPPTRLSELLVSGRLQAGKTLKDIENQAQGRFSMGDLLLLESGSIAVSDADIEAAAVLYGIDLGTVTRGSAKLIIDRHEGRLLVGNAKGKFKPTDDDRQVMLRYLALVFQLRETTPGRVLPPRESDLDVLSHVFSCSRDHVRESLEELMLHHSAEIQNRHAMFRRKFLVPTIGVLVALTAAGGLLLVNSSSGGAAPNAPSTTPVAAAQTSIGTALTIERSDQGTITIEESSPVAPVRGAAASGESTESNIGTALTIERKTP